MYIPDLEATWKCAYCMKYEGTFFDWRINNYCCPICREKNYRFEPFDQVARDCKKLLDELGEL